jgi:2-phosphosulfolactate phosphatase
MKIHITLTARDIKEKELPGRRAVVIDVLRATSVILTALANGASWVTTVSTIEEAEAFRTDGVLLGGERHALPIKGFDFSNSPLEYAQGKMNGNGIVLTTTNGTQAIARCSQSKEVVIGAFLNQRKLADYLVNAGSPVELVCAGTNGEFSLDDFLCAGMICTTMNETGNCEFDDLGKLAMKTWHTAKGDIHKALSGSTHYEILKNKGFIHDLNYCLSPDSISLLAILNHESSRFNLLTF